MVANLLHARASNVLGILILALLGIAMAAPARADITLASPVHVYIGTYISTSETPSGPITRTLCIYNGGAAILTASLKDTAPPVIQNGWWWVENKRLIVKIVAEDGRRVHEKLIFAADNERNANSDISSVVQNTNVYGSTSMRFLRCTAKTTGKLICKKGLAVPRDSVIRVRVVNAANSKESPQVIGEQVITKHISTNIAYDVPIPEALAKGDKVFILKCQVFGGSKAILESTTEPFTLVFGKPARAEEVILDRSK